MKQVIWPSPQGASFLLAVSYTALDETREMTKKLLAQYAQASEHENRHLHAKRVPTI